MNLRELILTAPDTAIHPVQVPEWKTLVYVRALTIAEREAIDADSKGKATDNPGRFGTGTLIAVRCIVDADGVRVFKDSDAEAVSKKSAAAITRIVNALLEHSGMTEKASADLGEASAGAPATVSPSSLPATSDAPSPS